jgi:hypothetical protein
LSASGISPPKLESPVDQKSASKAASEKTVHVNTINVKTYISGRIKEQEINLQGYVR